MGFINRFMRFFFFHLYHTFAWTYDRVSAIVSLGRWQVWTRSVLPFIQGRHVLELGFGPGHLQGQLRMRPGLTVGLDESRQMARLAGKRLRDSGGAQINLVRGLAQALPFPAASLNTVVSTFPAEYIFDAQTMREVHRVLQPGGSLVILPAAWITGGALLDRLAAWIFHVTGESPPVREIFTERAVHPLEKAGFKVSTQLLDFKTSLALLIRGIK